MKHPLSYVGKNCQFENPKHGFFLGLSCSKLSFISNKFSTQCYDITVDVRKMLRKREETIPSVIGLMAPEEDTLCHEFAALALCSMANDYTSKVCLEIEWCMRQKTFH